MSRLKFHEEDQRRSRPTRPNLHTDSFGLSTFLVKQGLVKNIRSAKRLSNIIMLAVVIIAFIVILILNTSGSKSSIDEKYFYDPTLVD